MTDDAGAPVAGAELDIWHADADGYYSGFDPRLPEGIFRGKVLTNEDGRYEVRTVLPAPYTIPSTAPPAPCARRRAGARGARPTST